MKLVIDGYGKSIHKKDNQIIIHEKDQIIDSIRASEISDITVVGKGYMTFDALDLMAENNIKLIAINPRGRLTYTLESPDWQSDTPCCAICSSNHGFRTGSECIYAHSEASLLQNVSQRQDIALVRVCRQKSHNEVYSPAFYQGKIAGTVRIQNQSEGSSNA